MERDVRVQADRQVKNFILEQLTSMPGYRDVKKRPKAVLSIGFPVSTKIARNMLESYLDTITAYRKLRLPGADALLLTAVFCRLNVKAFNAHLLDDAVGRKA